MNRKGYKKINNAIPKFHQQQRMEFTLKKKEKLGKWRKQYFSLRMERKRQR